jgi:hypothetical protein
MSRLFAFGGRFTNYTWPTWTDIAGRQLEIRDSTAKWTNEVNDLVMLNQSLNPLWLTKSVKRF